MGVGIIQLNFSAYDPVAYPLKYYHDFVGNWPSPRETDMPLGATLHETKLTSLMPTMLGLSQIVPFEYYIEVDPNAKTPCTNDQITITGVWNTTTNNGDDFGFDENYKVVAAFVDANSSDPDFHDPSGTASVISFSSLINADGDIEGTIEVGGLDPGDKIIVEVWLVLQNSIGPSVGGNVQTSLKMAKTSGSCETDDAISTGNQTVPLLQVGDFYTADADLSIIKNDSQDPVRIGTTFSYTLSLTNNGPAVANNITLVDNLSSSNLIVGTITFSSGVWTYEVTDKTITLNTLSLDIGQTVEITIPVTWSLPYTGPTSSTSAGTGGPGTTCSGNLTNSVTVSSITDDPNTTNNSSCEPTNVYCSSGSCIISGPTPVCPSGTYTYSTEVVSGATYVWTISGDGGTFAVTPDINGNTVSVSTSSNCDKEFILQVTVKESSGCEYTCSKTVT